MESVVQCKHTNGIIVSEVRMNEKESSSYCKSRWLVYCLPACAQMITYLLQTVEG